MTNRQDFQEVSHTGGRAKFSIESDVNGCVKYAVGYSHSRPTLAALVGIYAHPDGFACGNIKMGGIGEPFNAPPFPSCIAVMMASDSQGKFGHECPRCNKHFRTSGIPSAFPLTCPYCGLRTASWRFLTPPQKNYIKHYVDTLENGLTSIPPNTKCDIVIDMDKVADAVANGAREDFYYSSTTQQTAFTCHECGNFNDVLGRYAYCANCGWRSNLAVLKSALFDIRENIKVQTLTLGDAVKRAVSEFDSCARNYMDQLETRIPMKEGRRKRVQELLFHNIEKVDQVLQNAFDIDILRSTGGAKDFIKLMFHRRHAFEHDGGVATARYIRESGDTTVTEGMLIRETLANVHRLIDCLVRMAETFDSDFHEIFPPNRYCIDIENERRARMATHDNN